MTVIFISMGKVQSSTKAEWNIGAKDSRTRSRLRQERSMTVTGLAARANILIAMISRMENGNVSSSLAILQSLSDALSVSIMASFSNSANSADVHHVHAGSGLPGRRVTAGQAHDYFLLGKHIGPGRQLSVRPHPDRPRKSGEFAALSA